MTFKDVVDALNPHSVFFHLACVEQPDLLLDWSVAFARVINVLSVGVPLACHTDISRRACEFIGFVKLVEVYGSVEVLHLEILRGS